MSPGTPLTTNTSPLPGVTVGSPRPAKLLHDQSRVPVSGSYDVTAFSPFTTSSFLPPPTSTSTGVVQPPRSGAVRGDFHASLPSFLLTATREPTPAASQFWMTRSPTMTGEAAVPHSPGKLPRSRDQSGLPSTL